MMQPSFLLHSNEKELESFGIYLKSSDADQTESIQCKANEDLSQSTVFWVNIIKSLKNAQFYVSSFIDGNRV